MFFGDFFSSTLPQTSFLKSCTFTHHANNADENRQLVYAKFSCSTFLIDLEQWFEKAKTFNVLRQ